MTPEKRKRSKSCRRNINKPSPSSEEYRYKTIGMIFGDLDPVRYDRIIDPPPKACFNCWSLDHNRKLCTEPFTNAYCCNCGRSGLNVKNCPRCARAYQELRPNLKDWIDRKFNFNNEADREQTAQMKENGDNEDWYDNDCKDDYQTSPSPDDQNIKNDKTENKPMEYKDEDFGWEPVKSYHNRTTVFAEPNDLFSYMRAKKMRDEFKNDKINNFAVNLDDTRMADKDSFDENSIVSVYDFLKKDEESLRSSGQPLQDMLNLLAALKHLPVKTQDLVILQYISERKKQFVKGEMQSVQETKSP